MTNEIKVMQDDEIKVMTKEFIRLKDATMNNVIKMGEILIKVKESLPHGKFGEWLENEVDFSQRTANQLMKITREFGSNSQAISNLDSTKLYLLAELPVDDREDFMNENDLQNISTREMKERIKDYKKNVNDFWNIVDRTLDENTYEIFVDELKPFPNHDFYFPEMKGRNYLNFLTSIEKYGIIQPVIITRDNTIISGHQRVRACKDLGIVTIPAHYLHSENKRNYSLNDLLLDDFLSSNFHTRTSIFWLAVAWREFYFGDKEKSQEYMDKFVNEGDEIDKKLDDWMEEKRQEIAQLKAKHN
ncbi:DUF3102 domain-containing protein [Anaerotignum propionicum]|uniref:ParB-like nuclease domain protein n=1 Tax=Anaerotignum propionicum DSM 1682 TaxID=991789 RepID=A0A0X8VD17_ANAPI|nr:DUF3102 domain-containing protein [Anaerotignum propionicum]AMJ41711.1 ParB-like nuclease domain protein [Anaerotignum propionicum DSM 1682]SHE83004.1 ParB-like nuclease domain-containing protein [[Clostridium] propionicum DSM 1682] [Anaerotignum propionicum DSM 1682]